MGGYDLEAYGRLSDLTIPLIAHGGCGSAHHMTDAFNAGADAVAAGAMFQFTDTTPAEAAQALLKAGVMVRSKEGKRVAKS